MFGEGKIRKMSFFRFFVVAYFCILLKPKSTTEGVEQPLLILINDAHNTTTLGMSQRPCHVQKYLYKRAQISLPRELQRERTFSPSL